MSQAYATLFSMTTVRQTRSPASRRGSRQHIFSGLAVLLARLILLATLLLLAGLLLPATLLLTTLLLTALLLLARLLVLILRH
jgi:hypothetical protein